MNKNSKTENFKFVQNIKCEYFPCHKIADDTEFNCLFCFCPLYMLKDECGGDFKYLKGVKNCSGCVIPHSKSGYEFIMSKMDKIIEISSQI